MTKGDEPAFPGPEFTSEGEFGRLTRSGIVTPGLTKRELFAAMAMQGMSRFEFSQAFVKAALKDDPGFYPGDYVAKMAVGYADALIAELAKSRQDAE